MKNRGTEIESFLEELYKFEHETPYNPAVIEARYNRMIDSFIDHNIDSVPVYVTSEIDLTLPHTIAACLKDWRSGFTRIRCITP